MNLDQNDFKPVQFCLNILFLVIIVINLEEKKLTLHWFEIISL